MYDVTNLGRAPQHFRTRGGKLETVQPGETRALALANRDAAATVGAEHAGLIKVAGGAAKAKAPPAARAPRKARGKAAAQAPSGVAAGAEPEKA